MQILQCLLPFFLTHEPRALGDLGLFFHSTALLLPVMLFVAVLVYVRWHFAKVAVLFIPYL
jgi:hypothetical protein